MNMIKHPQPSHDDDWRIQSSPVASATDKITVAVKKPNKERNTLKFRSYGVNTSKFQESHSERSRPSSNL